MQWTKSRRCGTTTLSLVVTVFRCRGIHTITFNCGFALLHLVGMLVTSGLYGFITASGQRTSWHWDSFFATRHSSLLQLVYLLFFSKAYAGHTFLFLNWAIVMTFSFFLMSGLLFMYACVCVCVVCVFVYEKVPM